VKTVTIHQPNYLPGSGYFAKMALADVFVMLDDVQYSKNNWTNRNRIKTANGPQWITIPVQTSGRAEQLIRDVEIDTRSGWPRKHRAAIQTSYGKAQHFEQYHESLFDELSAPWTSLAALNTRLIKLCASWLRIDVKFVESSELGVSGAGKDLIAGICESLQADKYLSGTGGRNYLDMADFRRRGISVDFVSYRSPAYQQLHGDFVENMSIIDLLFNNGGASRALIGRETVTCSSD